MSPALHFVHAMFILITEGNLSVADAYGRSESRLGASKLETSKSEVAADVSHNLKGFYELADILIMLDKVLCLEVWNFDRQPGDRASSPCDNPSNSQPVVPEYRSGLLIKERM